MRKILSICILLSIGFTSYSQLFNKVRLGALTQTYGIEDKSLFLVNQNNVPDTSKKATGSQLVKYIFQGGSTNYMTPTVAPDSVVTIKDGKMSKTPIALSGFAFGVFSGYGSGTAYTLTNSATASIDFTGTGAVDPNITLSAAGTYIIYVTGVFNYNGYAFGSTNTINFRLRRTNNTSADLANSTHPIPVPILASPFSISSSFSIVPIIYTTANTNDNIAVTGQLVTTAGITGNITVSSCGIVAIRLY